MSSLKQFINFILWSNLIFGIIFSFQTKEPELKSEHKSYSSSVEKIYTEQLRPLSDSLNLEVSYPQGSLKLMQFIYSNLRWPPNVGCIEGTVVVSFVINKNGTPSDHRVVRSLHKSFDNEVLRVVKLLKNWNPRIQMGNPVKTLHHIPVRFRLE